MNKIESHRHCSQNVGIITVIMHDNYGTVLQAYALSSFLKYNGYSPKFIKNTLYLSNPQVKSSTLLCNISILKEIDATFGISKAIDTIVFYLIKIVINRGRSKKKHNENLHTVIQNFRNQYLFISNYVSDVITNIDVYIVGSDNVWGSIGSINLLCPQNTFFFLDFVPQNKNRIAYAPSMGEPFIPLNNIDTTKYLLSNFDSLSVREKSTAYLLEEISGYKVANTLDPVFLLTADEWENHFPEISHASIKKSYILVYSIYPIPSKSPIYRYAKKLSQELSIPLIHIGHSRTHGFSKYNDISVTDFLNYFKHATYIITNSFHGTAFSIIFKKSFYSFKPAKSHSPTRITDLLNLFNLSERFIDSIGAAEAIPLSVDYGLVENRINEERNFSKSWLLNAMLLKKQ